MPPENNTQALEARVRSLESLVRNLSAQVEAMAAEVPESQLYAPLDPISQAIIHENMLVAANPFVSGTPTINGHIPMTLNGLSVKIATVS